MRLLRIGLCAAVIAASVGLTMAKPLAAASWQCASVRVFFTYSLAGNFFTHESGCWLNDPHYGGTYGTAVWGGTSDGASGRQPNQAKWTLSDGWYGTSGTWFYFQFTNAFVQRVNPYVYLSQAGGWYCGDRGGSAFALTLCGGY